jgi:hypothetical protein
MKCVVHIFGLQTNGFVKCFYGGLEKEIKLIKKKIFYAFPFKSTETPILRFVVL